MSNSIDERVFTAIRTKGHPAALELPVTVFSMTGNYGLFWLMLAAGFWFFGNELTIGILVLLPFVIYPTLLVNFVLKVALRRERPVHQEANLRPLVKVPSSRSFPSSHAAMSFAAAIFMSHFHPELWPLFFGLALLMSWSRVYVGVHYPSDVLAGTVVGIAMGWLILWLMT